MSDELSELSEQDDKKPSRGSSWLRYARDWGVSIGVAVLVYMGIGWLRAPDLPDEAPGFNLVTTEGEHVSLQQFRGQTVVLNFWATWCGPCRTEIPTFSRWSEEHPDVAVLGIATDGNQRSLAAAKDSMGISYPVLIGDHQVSADYQISTIPTTVVVGPDGQVQDVHVGIMMGWQLDMATGK